MGALFGLRSFDVIWLRSLNGFNVKCVGHGFVQGSVNLLYAEVTGSISDGQGCPG
jgi:hypothetical protein